MHQLTDTAHDISQDVHITDTVILLPLLKKHFSYSSHFLTLFRHSLHFTLVPTLYWPQHCIRCSTSCRQDQSRSFAEDTTSSSALHCSKRTGNISSTASLTSSGKMVRNFSKCSWMNSDLSYVKIIELRNKHCLISATQFRQHVDLFCNDGIYHWRQIIAPGNIENVEGLALSQEGKQQTHSSTMCD